MLVIPISSNLYSTFQNLAQQHRIIFISGLPGTGKSLMAQQLALIANEVGRKVHLLKYNFARRPFETERNLAKYPEIEGVTDPTIRKAVGLWAREAVHRWHEQHPEPEHLLIGELPLIGNRLTELIKEYKDDTEPLLTSDQTLFVVPIPSWEVREVIEETRARTLADPQHELERLEAPPNVLQALWEEVNGVARQIGLTKASPQTPYNPYIYGGVYEALLQHRHVQTILIDQILRPTQSVYDLDEMINQLQATAEEVDHFMGLVERSYTARELQRAVAEWHALITDNPKMPDPGPQLQLPMPENLTGVINHTQFSEDQLQALQALIALPVDAQANAMLPALDQAIHALTPEKPLSEISADNRKFDVYDSYFNVMRTDDQDGHVFLVGLLRAYRNVLDNLQIPPQTLTVVEWPMLRIALETTLRQFGV